MPIRIVHKIKARKEFAEFGAKSPLFLLNNLAFFSSEKRNYSSRRSK
jgi:hypothetical protein